MKTCTLPIVGEFINVVSDLDFIVECLTGFLALRDTETEAHTRRVTAITLNLARAINVPAAELLYIHCGAMLHDIGKIGIPDLILWKESLLTNAERDVMERHPVYAYELLSPIPNLRPALHIPYCHHEKWDGTGYLRGLKGTQIPFAARLFAIVDVWDALISDRPYRATWTREKTIAYICDQSGKHFDPEKVRMFGELLGSISEFGDINPFISLDPLSYMRQDLTMDSFA